MTDRAPDGCKRDSAARLQDVNMLQIVSAGGRNIWLTRETY